MVLVVRS